MKQKLLIFAMLIICLDMSGQNNKQIDQTFRRLRSTDSLTVGQGKSWKYTLPLTFPLNGQVLGYNGIGKLLSWVTPSGTPLTLTGDGIIVVSGTYPNLTVTGTEVDGSVSNEGSLTVGAGTASTSVISSNTSGSTAVTLTAGTGLGISETGNVVTLTNSSPDQTVSITGAGINGVTGTYPSFTITGTEVDGSFSNEGSLTVGAGTASTSVISSNTSGSTAVTLTAGTGLGISETGNVVTLTNSSPDQTVSITGAGINGVTGTYPNFTITGTEVDGSVSNEGSLTVGAGTASTSVISSNTSGSTAVTLTAGSGITLSEASNNITIGSTSSGTVTSVSAGNGMNFTTFTTSGAITMGTPTTISGSSSNFATGTTHSHEMTTGVISAGILHPPRAGDVYNYFVGRTISTTAPLAGGGNLGSNLTLSIPAANGSTNGYLSAADWTTFNNKGSGTVTSVALSLPAEISISGNPVTSSGTLSGTWASQTANKFFASPNGSSGAPSFRAMVAADIPDLSTLYIQNQNSTWQTGNYQILGNAQISATTGTGLKAYASEYAPLSNAIHANHTGGGTAIFAWSEFGRALEISGSIGLYSEPGPYDTPIYINRGGTTSPSISPWLVMNRAQSGTENLTNNFIQLSENSTTTGTRGGNFLYFENTSVQKFKVDINGNTTTGGKLTTAASTTTQAGASLPHGTAPTTPQDGDIWTTTAGIYVHINGATVGPLSAGGGGGSSADIQIFTTPGSNTWTKPTGAKMVQVLLIGGGGGGGSGRKGAAGTVRGGGGGGAGGGYSEKTISAALLSGTVTVTVGAGGAGGASQTTNSTNGNNGSAGTSSKFGTYLQASNGNGGGGGSASGGTAGTAGTSFTIEQGGAGGAANGTGGSGSGASTTRQSASGGGGGGGITTANAQANGGVGGAARVAANPNLAGGSAGNSLVDGGAGNSVSSSDEWFGGSGGGGGGSNITTNARAGGNGGLYGAGGGGGGASVDSTGDSGAGGNGADGLAVVITYF